MFNTQKTNTIELHEGEYELPIGYLDKDGVVHKRFTLREMTGEVQEAIGDKKIRTNPAKIVTELILGVMESLGDLPKINRNIIKSLTTIDRDYILVCNYLQSIDDKAEFTSPCTSCGENFDVEVDVEKLPVTYLTADSERTLQVELPRGFKDAEGNNFKKMTLTMPDGFVQEKVFTSFEQNPQQTMTQVLAMCTESVEGFNFKFDDFTKLSVRDRKHIQKQMDELKAGVEMGVSVPCPSCGKEQKAVIPFPVLLGE